MNYHTSICFSFPVRTACRIVNSADFVSRSLRMPLTSIDDLSSTRVNVVYSLPCNSDGPITVGAATWSGTLACCCRNSCELRLQTLSYQVLLPYTWYLCPELIYYSTSQVLWINLKVIRWTTQQTLVMITNICGITKTFCQLLQRSVRGTVQKHTSKRRNQVNWKFLHRKTSTDFCGPIFIINLYLLHMTLLPSYSQHILTNLNGTFSVMNKHLRAR